MEEEYKYLWVLDFNDLAVYNYKVKLYSSTRDYLKILESVGHDTDHIEWMLSPYDEAINSTSDFKCADQIRPPIDNNNVTNKQ